MDTVFETKRGSIALSSAHEADAPVYRELRLEALRNHPTSFGADYAVAEALPMSHWVERIQTPVDEGRTYFAVHDGNLIGMATIHRSTSPKVRHSASIYSVYVQPAWRGLRISEALIGRCVEWAQAHGVTVLKLAATSQNAAAIRCYLRCGFTIYGVEPRALVYEGAAFDEILMARLLTTPA